MVFIVEATTHAPPRGLLTNLAADLAEGTIDYRERRDANMRLAFLKG